MATYGYGTVRRRNNHLFEGIYYVNGKRKSIYRHDEETVREELIKIRERLQAENPEDPGFMTLYNWLKKWLDTYASTRIRSSTYVSYLGYIDGHILQDDINEVPLKKLTLEHFQEFINRKYLNGRLDGKGGLSPKTLKNMRNMLHYALDIAVENNMLNTNPIERVILPQIDYNEMRVLSLAEQYQLEKCIEQSRQPLDLGAIIILYTGLRVGELTGLQWKDIDLVQQKLKVRHTLARQSLKSNAPAVKGEIICHKPGKRTALILGLPKTKKAVRMIPLSKAAIKALQTLQTWQQQKLEEDAGFNPHHFVLCNEDGLPIEPRQFEEILKKLSKKAGISDIHVHSLRHTFATRSLEQGMDYRTLSDLVGHENVAFTLQLYGHSTEENKFLCINRLDHLSFNH